MKILMIIFPLVALAACAPHLNTTDLAPGMTQQEVVQRLGKPISSTMLNGDRQLIFKIDDHAFDRDDNYYSIGFKEDRLVSIVPLPENMQEERGGLIDRAIRARINSNLGGITPNAYGPGIHMDQYGRPVQLVPQ
jgi:SmpA / OmlA family